MYSLKVLKEILKSKPTSLTFPIILSIIFLILLLRGMDPFHALLPVGILSLIIILLTIALHKIRKWEEIIDLEKIDSEIEKKELEVREKVEERMNKILEVYNPNISKFFKILEKKGLQPLENIEKKLMKTKEKIFFIIESGEKPPKQKKTFFSQYVENVLSKNDIFEIFRVKIYGTNSFIIFSKNENIEIDVAKLYNNYYNYIDKQIRDVGNIELKRWYEELKMKNEPLILVTQPYLIPLSILINMLQKRLKKEDAQKIIEKINNILREEMEILKVKFSYLLEVVEFDEESVKRFESLEEKLVENLKKFYKIRRSTNYFSELLSKKDFINNFELNLRKLDENFFRKINNDQRYEELKTLIRDIQTKIFGVQI